MYTCKYKSLINTYNKNPVETPIVLRSNFKSRVLYMFITVCRNKIKCYERWFNESVWSNVPNQHSNTL